MGCIQDSNTLDRAIFTFMMITMNRKCIRNISVGMRDSNERNPTPTVIPMFTRSGNKTGIA